MHICKTEKESLDPKHIAYHSCNLCNLPGDCQVTLNAFSWYVSLVVWTGMQCHVDIH